MRRHSSPFFDAVVFVVFAGFSGWYTDKGHYGPAVFMGLAALGMLSMFVTGLLVAALYRSTGEL